MGGIVAETLAVVYQPASVQICRRTPSGSSLTQPAALRCERWDFGSDRLQIIQWSLPAVLALRGTLTSSTKERRRFELQDVSVSTSAWRCRCDGLAASPLRRRLLICCRTDVL